MVPARKKNRGDLERKSTIKGSGRGPHEIYCCKASNSFFPFLKVLLYFLGSEAGGLGYLIGTKRNIISFGSI